MLRLIFRCKVCGRDHPVPWDWKSRVAEPSGDAGDDRTTLEFGCDRRERSDLYTRDDIRWDES